MFVVYSRTVHPRIKFKLIKQLRQILDAYPERAAMCPVLRQLPAAWLAGVLATAMLVITAAVFSFVNGDLHSLVGCAGGVVFVPSLALGVVLSGSRVFEVVDVIW